MQYINYFGGHLPIGIKIFAIIPSALIIMLMFLFENFLWDLFKHAVNIILKILLGVVLIGWSMLFLYVIWGIIRMFVL